MITSMTGFGKGEAGKNGISVRVELRSVNSRYLEIFSNLPKYLNYKDLEMRDLVKAKTSRGKITISIDIEHAGTVASAAPVALNPNIAEAYFNALTDLRKRLKLKDAVTMENVLQCADIFKSNGTSDVSEEEWKLLAQALPLALDELNSMRAKEGRELARDLHNRIKSIDRSLERIEQLAVERVPLERQRLRERIAKLFESDEIDEQRLEMEIVLLADKLDISEECVRLKSHIKFFIETLKMEDQAGRKINFLLQEMHREVNTIGSKASDAAIAQLAVGVKEELERIREQVQNIE